MKRKQLHLLCAILLFLLLYFYSDEHVKSAVSINERSATVALVATHSDTDRVKFQFEQKGKDQENDALKIELTNYANAYANYKISDGEPYQFYVISLWIKTVDFSLKNKTGKGLCIMVCDKSDYNSDNVFSEMIKADTLGLANNQEGWVKLNRVAKLDDIGDLFFRVQIGWENNPEKGVVFIDDVKAIPVCKVDKYSCFQSADGKIRMVFRTKDIKDSDISLEKIQEWVNIYSEFRKSMKWLVGGLEPYEGTTDYLFTERPNHYGLAGNPIYINSESVLQDIKRIELCPTNENNNIIWPLLHEMSHTFDGAASSKISMAWVFDSEFFATYKSIYCLYNSEYGMGNDLNTGNKIIDHFTDLNYLDKGIYNYEVLIYRLLQILENSDNADGWISVHETFVSFNNLPKKSVPNSDYEKFCLFIEILSKKSKIDIRSHFSEKEWSTIEKTLKIRS